MTAGGELVVGTIASALAAEGAAPASDWAGWERMGRAAASGEGNGWRTRFADDAGLLAEHGFGAHCMTIDWARLEPSEGRIDGGEVERIRHQLDALRSVGIAPWACLFHTALPGWFADLGGFADDRTRGRHWARYVDRCGEWFGDGVAAWLPLHDPIGWAWDAFRQGIAPPGRQDPEAFAKAAFGTVLAWRDAWRQLRGGGPPVVLHARLLDLHVGDGTVPALTHLRELDALLWGSVVSALRDGIVSVPGLADKEVADLSGSADVVALTVPGALSIDVDGRFTPYPAEVRVDGTGWGKWPEGLGHVLRRAAELLPDRPFAIVGDGVGTLDAPWRRDVLRDTAAVIAEARRDGIDVRTWLVRSMVDGYEPGFGDQVPFGLFDRDRNLKEPLPW